VKDPETQLKGLELELPGVVDPNLTPILEVDYRTVVNRQFYWASSSAEVQLFRSAPYPYTGPVRDPVNGEWFTPTPSSPRRDLGDQIFYFVNEHSAQEFDQAPDTYVR
jgi:YHS domain-containing protein